MHPLIEQFDALDAEVLTAGFDFLIERLTADGREPDIHPGVGRIVLVAQWRPLPPRCLGHPFAFQG